MTRKTKKLPDFDFAQRLMLSLMSGLSFLDKEQVEFAVEQLAREFGMSNYFDNVVTPFDIAEPSFGECSAAA